MRQGKGDALPGTSMFNEADGYWLPLQEVLIVSLETSRLHAMCVMMYSWYATSVLRGCEVGIGARLAVCL